MIIVTGAAGFIGSNIVKGLNQRGITDIVAVDDLLDGDKFRNLSDLSIADYMDKNELRRRIEHGKLPAVQAVFHQGACSDTTERNGQFMMDNNYTVSCEIFQYAQKNRVQMIYASSAAVYGANTEFVEDIAFEKPLNVYGYSKFLFDQYVRRHLDRLNSQVIGLRYFNVYGPNEQHKGRMASVAYHHLQQFRKDKKVRLFGAWDGYPDGGHVRDFIYVDDVVNVNLHFLDHPQISGVFNCGTGKAQAFNDIAVAVVNYMQGTEHSLSELVEQGLIEYIQFPDDLKGRYQSYTQANLQLLRSAGSYQQPFLNVQQGVTRYMALLSPNRE